MSFICRKIILSSINLRQDVYICLMSNNKWIFEFEQQGSKSDFNYIYIYIYIYYFKFLYADVMSFYFPNNYVSKNCFTTKKT
jgi:hypothetical protein